VETNGIWAGQCQPFDIRVSIPTTIHTRAAPLYAVGRAGGHLALSYRSCVIDVNRLGQSGPAMLQHYMDVDRACWEAFGWHAMVVDGHDIPALLKAFAEAGSTKGKPSIILAETLKGKGMDGYEDKHGWHGKPLPEDEAERVAGILEKSLAGEGDNWIPNLPERRRASETPTPIRTAPKPPYSVGGKEVATRKAFGDALQAREV